MLRSTLCVLAVLCVLATAGLARAQDAGGCATDCSPYACANNACLTSCSGAMDCAVGYDCQGGACVPAAAATCSSDGMSSLRGDASRDCSPYRCEVATGACLAICNADTDCISGYVCDAKSKNCMTPEQIKQQNAPPAGGGCAVGGAPADGEGLLLLVLGVGVALMRRRRPRARA